MKKELLPLSFIQMHRLLSFSPFALSLQVPNFYKHLTDQAKQECKWTLFLNLSLATTEAQAPFQQIKLRAAGVSEHLHFKKRPADGANGHPRLRPTGLDPSW